jgi:nicotinate-nucleotide adenylyltransferase
MTPRLRVGLLGGTLDPIHCGHIETATAARDSLGLEKVHVLPSNVPPHRTEQPTASGCHRFAMTALAVNDIEGLLANDLELTTPGRSFTSDTLVRFSQSADLEPSQIFFITGADAFAEIATWHRYPEVLDLANFIVVSRPGFPSEGLRERLPDLGPRMQTVSVLQPAASSQRPEAKTRILLLDARTPDVSSTEIRTRLAEGRSIHGLVADTVERYIAKHRLYSPATSLSGKSLA